MAYNGKGLSKARRERKHFIEPIMQLIINGEIYCDLKAGLSVSALLAQLGLAPKKIAVERNLEIVSKSRYDDTVLRDGDQLEIIAFIGGG